MTPLLILVFGVKPVVAIGTDLAYGAVTKTRRRLAPPAQRARSTSACRSGWRSAACPGALVGVLLLDRLHERYGNDFDDVAAGAASPARC